MARPSLYSEDLLAEIVERLSAGEPMASICRDEGMPAARTVRDWIGRHPDVSAAIAHARDDGEDWLAAECLLIADTPMEGISEKLELVDSGGGVMELKVTERRREDMLGHRKLQIETRLKLLAKWNPRKWGDRQQVEHKVDESLGAMLGAARARLQSYARPAEEESDEG